MQVLWIHAEGAYDVYLQTTDIARSWERFAGRVGKEAALGYSRYSSTHLASLRLWNPDTQQAVDCEGDAGTTGTTWSGLWPVVFETNRYQVIIRILHKDKGTVARVRHVMRKVEAEFYPDPDQPEDCDRLTGTIDFINEPGTFRLEFEYMLDGRRRQEAVTFDVVSPKLDIKHDYRSIIKDVNDEYETLVFRYLSLTYQQFARGRITSDVVWLNTFEELIDHYLRYVESIVRQPHTRIVYKTGYAKADHIRHWTPQMEERYAEIKQQKRLDTHYYAYADPMLNVDSLENRFVKHTVKYIEKRLSGIFEKIEKCLDKEISDSRKELLNGYAQRLKRLSRHPFFTNVGRWEGMSSESLVLQSRQGYMQVYKDWLKLLHGIDLYDIGATRIGTLQIWEIYELWCFIKMKHMVRELLRIPPPGDPSYEELVREPKGSMLNPFTDTSLEHTVEFTYPDPEQADLSGIEDEKERTRERELLKSHAGDVVSLHYQHTFSRVKQDGFNIHTATTEQRPDIVLNVRKKDSGEIVLTYLYDAKYRVVNDKSLDRDFEQADIEEQAEYGGVAYGADYPPSDAINQMHRYRDAIYYGSELGSYQSKEIIGGYILFPGRGDDDSLRERYFSKSVEKINIGAFPLTPSADPGKEGKFLRSHLHKILLEKIHAYEHVEKAIPQRGLSYSEDIPASPVLLLGYLNDKNRETFIRSRQYYVRIIRGTSTYPLDPNYNKVEYLLVHDGKQKRSLYKVKGKPKTLSGRAIKDLGFHSDGEDTDIYLSYTIADENPIEYEGLDIQSIKLGSGKERLRPHYTTMAHPDAYSAD